MKRSKSDKMIGGVCAAIAKETGLSSAAVRIITVILTIWTFIPALIYLLLWVIIPEEKE
jgi:phage shock protein PspC (stress-responsive transcriptional regulator)